MSESALQMSIVQALQLRGIYAFSVPNEALGKINARLGYNRMGRLKAMGLRAGVADLVCILPGRVVFLEVKTDKGRQSPAQIDFEKVCTDLGHDYYVVRSVTDALAVF